jgi:hypothetical protein
MRIDVQDSVAVGQQVAKRARKRALEGVEAARAVDLHGPAEAAKTVAKHTAKRAAKQATAAANRAARRKTKRASKRVLRAVLVAFAAGAVVAVAVAVVRRRRSTTPPWVEAAPDSHDPTLTDPRPAEDGLGTSSLSR